MSINAWNSSQGDFFALEVRDGMADGITGGLLGCDLERGEPRARRVPGDLRTGGDEGLNTRTKWGGAQVGSILGYP